MINKHIIVGRVGQTPDIKAVNSKKVASFSVASSESWRDPQGNKIEHTEWHNIVAWSPLAEIIEKYVQAGALVYIEGKSKTRNYEKDGRKIYVTEVLTETFKILANAPQKPS